MGLIVLLLAAIALVGCKPALVRAPSFGAHTIPVDQWVGELDDPPPPVQAEEVAPDPGPSYVWIDGQWVWQPLTRRGGADDRDDYLVCTRNVSWAKAPVVA